MWIKTAPRLASAQMRPQMNRAAASGVSAILDPKKGRDILPGHVPLCVPLACPAMQPATTQAQALQRVREMSRPCPACDTLSRSGYAKPVRRYQNMQSAQDQKPFITFYYVNPRSADHEWSMHDAIGDLADRTEHQDISPARAELVAAGYTRVNEQWGDDDEGAEVWAKDPQDTGGPWAVLVWPDGVSPDWAPSNS